MPLFGYCLSELPTLIELPIHPARFPNLEHINPFVYTLLGTIQNQPNVEKFLQSITRFYSEKDPTLPTLGSFFNKVSGMVPLTHSLEGPALPTWHSLPTPRCTATKPKVLTDTQFAKLLNFCDVRTTYKGTLKVPKNLSSLNNYIKLKRRNSVPPNLQFNIKYSTNQITYNKTFYGSNPTPEGLE